MDMKPLVDALTMVKRSVREFHTHVCRCGAWVHYDSRCQKVEVTPCTVHAPAWNDDEQRIAELNAVRS